MACPRVEMLISTMVDGESDALQRHEIESHVSACDSCREVVKDWLELDRQLRAAFSSHERCEQVKSRVKKRLTSSLLRRCSLLVVDDEDFVRFTLVKLLSSDFEVLTAQNAEEAQSILSTRSVDVILTDQRMPGKSGVGLLEWARVHSPKTIRLLMTGYSELDDAVDAINRGHIYHYLLKPWRTEDVLQTVRNAADKFELERKRERYLEELWELNRELEHRVALRTRDLQAANLLLEQRTRELERLALTDPLTGLFNRRAMEELARFELKRHARYPSPISLGYIDIDHFKEINTRYLHTGGDEVLRTLARLLASTIREVDSVGRVGGEEFLVIARETTAEGVNVLAERRRSRVATTPIAYQGERIQITISVGFAVAEVGVPVDLRVLIEAAAEALGQAKAEGRNRCKIICLAGTGT